MNQLIDPSLSQLLLGAMIATLVFLFAGSLVAYGFGSWIRSWLSGFDGLTARRDGGKLRFEGVIVDKARPLPRAVKPRAKRKTEQQQKPNGATETPLAFPREGRPS